MFNNAQNSTNCIFSGLKGDCYQEQRTIQRASPKTKISCKPKHPTYLLFIPLTGGQAPYTYWHFVPTYRKRTLNGHDVMDLSLSNDMQQSFSLFISKYEAAAA